MKQNDTSGQIDPQIQALLKAAAAPQGKPSEPAPKASGQASKASDQAPKAARPASPVSDKAPQKQHTSARNDTAARDKDKPKDGAQRPKSLIEAIREQASEADIRPMANLTLRTMLGGEILATPAIRKQVGVILLVMVFMLVYISDRYSCQQSLIKIDRLTQELNDAKYKALSSNSQITEKSRESRVLEMLQSCKDSTLHIATQPPYIIQVPDE